jgi:thiol-disulfide isomerase/thioredoxin
MKRSIHPGRISCAVLPLVLGLVLAGCARDVPPSPGLNTVGDLAVPSLAASWTLRDLDGNEVSSERFKGKVVVLDFWATWCVPCVEEMPTYIALQEKYRDQGLEIVGVSMDRRPVADVKRFVEEKRLNYTVVMGDEPMRLRFGGFEQIPVAYLIDREGVIRHAKMGIADPDDYDRWIRSLLQ